MTTTFPDITTFFLWQYHQLLVFAIIAASLLCISGGVDAFVSPSISVDCSLGRHTLASSRCSTTQQHFMVREPALPNFCADCGSPDMVLKIPDGDERLRACCDKCDRIEYQNPKVVVACVIRTHSSSKDKTDLTLFAKRAIEPRKGTWGIPQGFMENGETTRQAAVREVYEETGAVIDPALLKFRAVYNVPGSVQLVYEARVDGTKLQQDIESYKDNCHESLEVALLDEAMLAEKEICFPTVQWALDHCRSVDNDDDNKRNSGAFIQQMTKSYDADTDVWNQYEDEPLLEQK